jgi:hypothetical protein
LSLIEMASAQLKRKKVDELPAGFRADDLDKVNSG